MPIKLSTGTPARMAAALFVSFYSAAAAADNAVIDITSISYNSIEVESNGSSYSTVNAPALFVNANMELDGEFSGRVRSWKAWPSIIGIGFEGEKIDFKNHQVSANYPVGQRPKRVTRHFTFILTGNEVGTVAKSYCNAMRRNYLTAGKSIDWILSQDRTYDLLVDAEMNYDISGIPGAQFIGVGELGNRKIAVTCKKYTPKTTNHSVAAVPGTLPEVTQASVAVFPEASMDGSYCRVRLSAVLGSNKINMPLSYRYRYSDNNPNTPDRYSDTRHATTSHSKIVMVSDVFDVPVVDGPETGSIRVESVSPNVRQSSAKSFEMECSPNLSVQAKKPIEKIVKFEQNKTQKFADQVCPVAGHMVIILKGSGTPFEGIARLTVRNEAGELHSTGNHDVSLSASGTAFFGMPYNVTWGSAPTGFANQINQEEPREQKLNYTLALLREGETGAGVLTEKAIDLKCVIVQTAPVAAGAATSVTSTDPATNAPSLSSSVMMNASALLPDLAIQKIQQTGKQRIKVLVKNKGVGPSAATSISFTASKGNQVTKPLPALKKGQKKWVTLRLPKQSSTSVVYIDPDKKVAETNEGNNKRQHRFK
ncbi:CARDB domain-containing protein [Sneathiella glossodoripedis]|uniref:CARDB domain-containing protein n=1 Tax=Sneathiella glossodoripedis TaxID=418853 RepID=UPI0004703567|nr:CARDB domain-containing protein [Sneathiella glossodoripedis]